MDQLYCYPSISIHSLKKVSRDESVEGGRKIGLNVIVKYVCQCIRTWRSDVKSSREDQVRQCHFKEGHIGKSYCM